MVTLDDVRADLPRSCEAFVRGRVKFRVGRMIVPRSVATKVIESAEAGSPRSPGTAA
jgi:hypothetical protein